MATEEKRWRRERKSPPMGHHFEKRIKAVISP